MYDNERVQKYMKSARMKLHVLKQQIYDSHSNKKDPLPKHFCEVFSQKKEVFNELLFCPFLKYF